ncbi:MAG: 50S ribosomal protein L11 methyltransferase [Alphaproteobacteria bacterium]|nr:50S ribosomal protein L11 methyltransferase [Alphaproteobacteria bacterium]OJV15779.1 MAG: hypothetical protein BGO27_07685 [Alphaproteobacteria bacterium 33-17]
MDHNPFQSAEKIYLVSCSSLFKHTGDISTLLEEYGATVSYFEEGVTTHIDPLPDDEWKVEAYFNDNVPTKAIEELNKLALKFKIDQIDIQEIEDKDWVTEVQKNIPVIEIPPFIISDPVKLENVTGQHVIAIEAGRAFGTGTHETTSLCIEALVSLTRSQPLKRIIDVGTGSGILAIAASRLTNARVFASDIDKVAVEVARRNLKINNVKNVKTYISNGINNRIMFLDPFTLVIANILAQPLIDMAKDISRIVEKNGFIILSGFLKNQEASVEAAYVKRKFKKVEAKYKGDWVMLLMQKNV